MNDDTPAGVEIRLIGGDADEVEAAARWLSHELGARLVITRRATTRRAPGLRLYGAVYPPPPTVDKTDW